MALMRPTTRRASASLTIVDRTCCVRFMALALPSIRSRTKGASDTMRTKAREANSACFDGARAG